MVGFSAETKLVRVLSARFIPLENQSNGNSNLTIVKGGNPFAGIFSCWVLSRWIKKLTWKLWFGLHRYREPNCTTALAQNFTNLKRCDGQATQNICSLCSSLKSTVVVQ